MAEDWVTTTEWVERKLRSLAQRLRLRAEKDRAKKARILEQKVTKRLDDALAEKRPLTNGALGKMVDIVRDDIRADARHRGMIDKSGKFIKPGVDKDNRPAEKLVNDDVRYGKGLLGITKRKPVMPVLTPDQVATRNEREQRKTELLREKEYLRLDQHEMNRYHTRWIEASDTQAERINRSHCARTEMRELISFGSAPYHMLEQRRFEQPNIADAKKYDRYRDRIAKMTGEELRDRSKERAVKMKRGRGGPEM